MFAAPPAVAQQPNGKGTDLFVTIAARECPSYTDIMANRARNDIQESLRDLGKNTVYKAGQPIEPGVEATNDPNCTPLSGWRFTLGTGYRTRAVSGPWGSLSIVTDPYDTDIVTEDRVPLLDPRRWLRVVVDFNSVPGWMVTVLVQDNDPRGTQR